MSIGNLKPHKFPPGVSGNPAGRPPGSKNLSTHIIEMLNDPDFELKFKDGKTITGRPIKAILKTAIAKAISGDMKAFDMLAKYGYGVKQIHEFQNNPIEQILGKYGLNNAPAKPESQADPEDTAKPSEVERGNDKEDDDSAGQTQET